MKSLIASRRDLELQLFEVLDAEALASPPRFAEHSRETFLSALDTAFDVADAKFAPDNRAADEHEPTFEDGRLRLATPRPDGTYAITGTKRMISRRSGKIVNVSSTAGLAGSPPGMHTVAYNASKAAAIGFTRALASEWGRYDINVNAICPGFSPTKMAHGLLEKIGEAMLEGRRCSLDRSSQRSRVSTVMPRSRSWRPCGPRT